MKAYQTAAANPSDLVATEADNHVVWDGRSGGRYEVWFLTLNHRASKTGFWIRHIIEAPVAGDAYAEVWFAAFDANDPQKNFGVHKRHAIEKLSTGAAPFEVKIGESVFRHDGARGSVTGDGHRASWDLQWLPAAHTHRLLPDLAYHPRFPADARVVSPNLDVPVRGTIDVDGRSFTLEGEPGTQTHIWGRKHAHAWAWGHCNAFEAKRGATLEAFSGRLKRRGFVLPPLTLVTLFLDGEALRFTGFKDTLRARTSFGTAHYRLSAGGLTARFEAEFTCKPADMLLSEYADPDGEPVFCANTEVGDLHVTVWRRSRPFGRWHEQARLYAPKTGHFEVAGRDRDPAIGKHHVLV